MLELHGSDAHVGYTVCQRNGLRHLSCYTQCAVRCIAGQLSYTADLWQPK